MVKNIESKKNNRENHKKYKVTKFSAILLIIGIICVLIAECMAYGFYSEDKNLSYFFIFLGILIGIMYVKLAFNSMKGKRMFIIDLPIEGELPKEYYATFGWVFIVILNLIVCIPIFVEITCFSLVISQKLHEVLWSVLFVVLPYVIIIVAVLIFKLEKLNNKIWGFTSGSVLGAILNSIIILPATIDKNIMYSKLVIFLVISVILWIISFILKKLNLVKNTMLLMLATYYLWAGIIFWNESFDSSKTITYDVTVENKGEYSNSKSGSHYIIKIDDGDRALGIDKLYVLNYEYSSYEVGDCIRISYRQGAFGLPYIEDYVEVRENPYLE